MLSVIYFALVGALAVLSLTRKRIFIICGFYCFYALLTVLDEGSVPHLGPLTVYRALYLILGISFVARLIQDRGILLRSREWLLKPYFSLLFLLVASSLYSHSNTVFSSEDDLSLLSRIVILSLFWIAASHVHEETDLKIIAGTTVAVSLVLSLWVIRSAALLDFEAYRGGVEVNQNYIAVFVLGGAIPVINFLIIGKGRALGLLSVLAVLCQVFASLILASRGMFVAVVVAAIFMAAKLFRNLGYKTMLALSTVLALVFAVALFLPGSGNLFARFQGEDLATLNYRTEIWSHSFRYFSDSGIARMIFGHGLLSGRHIIRPVFPDFENYHNVYLLWLMDQGIVGLIAFVGFLWCVIRQIFKWDRPLKSVMIGWLAFFSVAGLSSTISDERSFWILLGVMVGVTSLAGNSRSLGEPAIPQLSCIPPSASTVPRSAEGF